MNEQPSSKKLGNDELLDELAALAKHWASNRDANYTPVHIRTAMLGVIGEITGTAHEPPAALCVDPAFERTRCPFTKRAYFMHLEHPELGRVPTYGGPLDSYTIPVPDDDGESTLRCERYDHDAGAWVDGGEPLPWHVISNEELARLHNAGDAEPPPETPDYTAVYDACMIGSAVRNPQTLLGNVENAVRRSECLSAIERQFFTLTQRDEDGEEFEHCAMNWGAGPAEYIEQFRKALDERAIQPPSVAIAGLVAEMRAQGYHTWATLIERATQPPSLLRQISTIAYDTSKAADDRIREIQALWEGASPPPGAIRSGQWLRHKCPRCKEELLTALPPETDASRDAFAKLQAEEYRAFLGQSTSETKEVRRDSFLHETKTPADKSEGLITPPTGMFPEPAHDEWRDVPIEQPAPGHFWRGEPESNRHQCRNCGEHYDKHLHTDEASRCPTVDRTGYLDE